jgi:hypothetical protein
MDFDQTLYIVIPSPTKLRRGYSNATVRPSVRASVRPSVTFLVNTLVNMVQWISTKLETRVILTKIWHPIDFQGQRSRSQLNFEFVRGLTARGYATLCVALVYYLFQWKRCELAVFKYMIVDALSEIKWQWTRFMCEFKNCGENKIKLINCIQVCMCSQWHVSFQNYLYILRNYRS